MNNFFFFNLKFIYGFERGPSGKPIFIFSLPTDPYLEVYEYQIIFIKFLLYKLTEKIQRQ